MSLQSEIYENLEAVRSRVETRAVLQSEAYNLFRHVVCNLPEKYYDGLSVRERNRIGFAIHSCDIQRLVWNRVFGRNRFSWNRTTGVFKEAPHRAGCTYDYMSMALGLANGTDLHMFLDTVIQALRLAEDANDCFLFPSDHRYLQMAVGRQSLLAWKRAYEDYPAATQHLASALDTRKKGKIDGKNRVCTLKWGLSLPYIEWLSDQKLVRPFMNGGPKKDLWTITNLLGWTPPSTLRKNGILISGTDKFL